MVLVAAPVTPLNEKESATIKDFLIHVFGINLSDVVFEMNLVENTNEWWVDIRATRHICSKKKMFSTYQSVEYGEQLFMENSSTSKVEGK